MRITKFQCMAVRALENWPQKKVAELAGIGESTVSDFEGGERTPSERTSHAIWQAFHNFGIRFPAGGVLCITGRPILCAQDLPPAGLHGWYMARLGAAFDDNPFPKGSTSAEQWDAGYNGCCEQMSASEEVPR